MIEENIDPPCFGYFMNGKNCDECEKTLECYKKWKANGEPKKTCLKCTRPLTKETRLSNCSSCD